MLSAVCVCATALFPVLIIRKAWLASGWVVEMAGDISHLDAPALDELQR
jgi:hypothetical protein